MANYPFYNPYYQHQYQHAAPHGQSIIWVSGEQEAAAYPVAPNNAVALWDSESPTIYLKQADAAGKPVMKTYCLIEREEPKSDEESFATRADIESIIRSLSEVRAELEGLKNDGKKKKKGEDDNE